MRANLLAAIGILALAAPAWADVKLHNKDSKAHDVTVKCRSTVQRSIQSGTIANLGKGPCTVTIKESGVAMTGDGDVTLIIPRSKTPAKR